LDFAHHESLSSSLHVVDVNKSTTWRHKNQPIFLLVKEKLFIDENVRERRGEQDLVEVVIRE
jgi:hypothetical protein